MATIDLSPLGKRIKEAMDREKMSEAELVAAIRKIAHGDEYEELRDKLSQQMVNHLTRGGGERSYYTPIIAAALRVSALWLAFGIGPMKSNDPPGKERLRSNDREILLLRAFRDADAAVQSTIERAINSKWEPPPLSAKRQKPRRFG